MNRSILLAAAFAMGVPMLSGCQSDDQAAAAEAAQAAGRAQAGNLGAAQIHIRKAIALRDDVAEYWQLAAQIDLALDDNAAAYNDYRTLIALDRANVEALRALCQLGAQYGRPDEVEKFADQLLQIAPNDTLPLVAKGGVALVRGDSDTALKFAEQALAASPGDVPALTLKARTLVRQRKYTEAAALLEGAAPSIGGSAQLYTILADTYRSGGDRAGYVRATKQLAASEPRDPKAMLRYAGLLYEDGDAPAARAMIVDAARLRPNDVSLASAILDLWLEEGAAALALETLPAQAADAPGELRAAYAQYANERGRPDLALAILGDLRGAGFGADKLNLQAAYAEALARSGRSAQARAVIAQLLEADGNHPRALIARARMLAAAKDWTGAIADLRQVVADDAANVTARGLLASAFFARDDATLAFSALREGAKAAPESARMAELLARALLANGRRAEASQALIDAAQEAPLSLRIARLRNRLCPATGVPACAAPIKPVIR